MRSSVKRCLDHASSHQVTDACRDQNSPGNADFRPNNRSRQSHVQSVQDEDGSHQGQGRRDTVRRRWKSAGSRAKVRARARTRRKGKAKARAKERAKKNQRARSSKGWCDNCGQWGHKAANCWHGEEKEVHQVQGKAGTASSSSSQSTLSATDVGTKEIALIESVCEDAEMSWIFMVADAVAINQLSTDGAHSLVVDSGAFVHVCPKSYATHVTLEALPACWRGLDLRSSSGKMLKVWENPRGGVERDGSARQSVRSESPLRLSVR